jgi:hypothetical protein
MATLPPVTLGAIIFGAFTIIALLHRPLERRLVLSAPISARPKRQFYLELSLMVLAGLIAVVYNRAFYNFPISSGISLVFGCMVSGFFAGLDTALNHFVRGADYYSGHRTRHHLAFYHRANRIRTP